MQKPPSWYITAKIIFGGRHSVGKSSISEAFINGKCDPEQYATTLGCSFLQKTFKVGHNNTQQIKLALWDTAGQERYTQMSQIYYRQALGALLVFDITDFESFAAVPQILATLRQRCRSDTVIILIGNKCDLHAKRQVPREEAENFAQQHGLTYVETSALTGENIDYVFSTLAQEIFSQNYCLMQKHDLTRVMHLRDKEFDVDNLFTEHEKKTQNSRGSECVIF